MITLTDIHKKFNADTQNEVYALQGIDLTIHQGEFITIIGTNGSGKSTLLNLLAGTIAPDTGSVFIRDQDVTGQKTTSAPAPSRGSFRIPSWEPLRT
jgi:putative tryptophan/tyrosine transport system ATP-binding protein